MLARSALSAAACCRFPSQEACFRQRLEQARTAKAAASCRTPNLEQTKHQNRSQNIDLQACCLKRFNRLFVPYGLQILPFGKIPLDISQFHLNIASWNQGKSERYRSLSFPEDFRIANS
jgi:hypothetical protein